MPRSPACRAAGPPPPAPWVESGETAIRSAFARKRPAPFRPRVEAERPLSKSFGPAHPVHPSSGAVRVSGRAPYLRASGAAPARLATDRASASPEPKRRRPTRRCVLPSFCLPTHTTTGTHNASRNPHERHEVACGRTRETRTSPARGADAPLARCRNGRSSRRLRGEPHGPNEAGEPRRPRLARPRQNDPHGSVGFRAGWELSLPGPTRSPPSTLCRPSAPLRAFGGLSRGVEPAEARVPEPPREGRRIPENQGASAYRDPERRRVDRSTRSLRAGLPPRAPSSGEVCPQSFQTVGKEESRRLFNHSLSTPF